VWWLGGIYSPTTKMTFGEGFCRMAHRTRAGAPATSPSRLVPTVGALTYGATGQSGGAPDSHCSLFGAPSGACSNSARAVAHCRSLFTFCRRPLALLAVTPLGTPDSPVNYSGVAPQILEASELERIHPGARDTVRWCTRHCPVAHRTIRCARPGQPSFSLLLSF
jgi:hypothetical protein